MPVWDQAGRDLPTTARGPTTIYESSTSLIGESRQRVAVFKELFTNPGYVCRGRSHSILAEATIIDFVGPTSKHFTHEYLTLKVNFVNASSQQFKRQQLSSAQQHRLVKFSQAQEMKIE